MIDSIAKVFTDFGDWLVDWLTYFISYLSGVVYAFGKYIINALRYMVEIAFYPFMSLLEYIIELMHLDFMVLRLNYFLTSSGFGYMLELFMVDDAIYSYLTAFFLRFIIRRIPFIG